MKKKRILQICTTPLMYDGLSKVILSLSDKADRQKYEVEILLTLGGKEELKDKLKASGIKVIDSVRRDGGVAGYIKSLLALLRENKYDVVHVHGNSATMAIEMFCAKCAGVERRIAHGHNTKTNYPLIHKTLRPFLNMWCNMPAACGRLAGEFLFGKRDFCIVANCIDTDRFAFDEEVRQKTRAKLGVGDELLIGHVGRFSYQKNHEFLIDIFCEIKKLRGDAKLVLVGEGELFDDVQKKVEIAGIKDSVMFYGTTEDTSDLYSAFDAFLLPSRFEGLAITAIESQAAGLFLVTSDTTTAETDIIGHCEFLSLNDSAGVWAQKTLSKIIPVSERKESALLVKEAGYDILSFGKTIDKIWN